MEVKSVLSANRVCLHFKNTILSTQKHYIWHPKTPFLGVENIVFASQNNGFAVQKSMSYEKKPIYSSFICKIS